MAEPVRARRLTDQEGRRLQQIVRRGKHGSIRVRRAMIIMASASGTPVSAIARLVAADEDTVRDVVHAFNAKGLAALDPRWAGGRPRLISDDDVGVIVAAATTRPEKLGLPFTCWSLRKLAAWLATRPDRPVRVGRERLRQILHARGISFQRTRTWTESTDPDRGRLARRAAVAGVLGSISSGRLGQQLLDLRQRPVRLLRRIAGQLGAIQAEQAQRHHAFSGQQPQHLAEQPAQRRLMPGPEPGDRRVIRAQPAGDHPVAHIPHTPLLDHRLDRSPWQ
jgi:transposase